MQQWTPDTLAQRFSQLDRKTDPIFHIYAREDITHSITIVGDAKTGRVIIAYSHTINQERLEGGFLRDSRQESNQEELYIDYGSEKDLIPYSETVSIEDALQIAVYFVEHEALPRLPGHLYWHGSVHP
jgi:hypothetical protein